MNDMTDLSFTQTSRAMSSLPLNRAKGDYKPIWVLAQESNEKPKRLIIRKNGVKVSDSYKPSNSVKPYCWMGKR